MMAQAPPNMDTILEVVRDLERERGCPIWCMAHCNIGHICHPTLWSVYANRHKVGQGDRIELLLHSGGGHPQIAFKVMKFFRRRFKTVNVIVPLMAKSAATLMCLGADKIFMGELAELGPVDIQLSDSYEHGDKNFSPLDEFKSMEFLRELSIDGMDYYAKLMNLQYGVSIRDGLQAAIPLMAELMKPIFAQIDPIKMGGYRRSIAIGEEYAKRMLALTKNPKAADIVQEMVWEYPSHDFCIDFEEAEELGLPVERLPEDQDHKLSAALLTGRGQYHGFVPQLKSTPAPRKSVRRNARRAANPQRVNGRVNGRERGGSEERV